MVENKSLVDAFYKPGGKRLPREGGRNVEVQVLAYQEGQFAMSLLRFGPNGTIDEHPAESTAEVFCFEGEGFVSVGKARSQLHAGQRVIWPKDVNHRLWTTDHEMEVLIVHRGED